MTSVAHRKRAARRARLPLLLACIATGCAGVGGDRQTSGPRTGAAASAPAQLAARPWVGQAYRQGVVAAPNPFGAEAGARVLEQGGNAVDAAVAVAYALNVVEPQSAGIGGGGFMMIHLADSGRTFAIDSREQAPAGAARDMFVGVPSASQQGVAVGVPGMVRGAALAVERYGRLSLAQVLQPAIELADDGFAATPRFVTIPDCGGTELTSRARNSARVAEYFCPGGRPLTAQQRVTNKPLAETLRLIAQHGPDCFYKVDLAKGCDIALGIVEGQRWSRPQAADGKGGSMTLADLEAYRPVVREPIVATYRGYTIKSMAPPSSGALTVLQILKMLERFPLGDASSGFGFGSVNTLNVMADAMRLAFADRGVWMADADFVPVPTRGLIDTRYLDARGAAIAPGRRLLQSDVPPQQQGTLLSSDPRPFETAGLSPAERLVAAEPKPGTENGTTHFSVVDRWGNVVSYTNTIESAYGIGVFAGYLRADGRWRDHGFLLNNELTDFNTTPSTNPWTGSVGFNDAQPGKRPRSSMAPTMLFSPAGQPILAYGSPGGATIINSVVNVTVNLVDHAMALQQAVDAARISVVGAASTIQLEPRFHNLAALQRALGPEGLGYSVMVGDVGSVQAVRLDPGTGEQHGAADDRREGTVVGLPRPRPR
jgi:gamma-glutamyltranspeptidase/glutathione hydrolase